MTGADGRRELPTGKELRLAILLGTSQVVPEDDVVVPRDPRDAADFMAVIPICGVRQIPQDVQEGLRRQMKGVDNRVGQGNAQHGNNSGREIVSSATHSSSSQAGPALVSHPGTGAPGDTSGEITCRPPQKRKDTGVGLEGHEDETGNIAGSGPHLTRARSDWPRETAQVEGRPVPDAKESRKLRRKCGT